MEKELRRKTFTEAPSFGTTCDAVPDPPIVEVEIAGDDNQPMDDFEFAFTLVESDPGALTETTAGEIFPVYPVFNRNLVAGSFESSSAEQELVERMGRLSLAFEKHDLRSGSASSSSSISSEADDPAAYCVWTPRSAPQSPDRWRMSQSTGSETSEFRRFRLRDLILGRSRSDGKEKVIVLPNPSHRAATEPEKKGKSGKGKGKGGQVKEMDVVTAYRIYYGKGAAVAQRSFLPYRQGLLGGFCSHGKRHPF